MLNEQNLIAYLENTLPPDERALVEWAREEPVEAQRVATGVERRPRRGKEI